MKSDRKFGTGLRNATALTLVLLAPATVLAQTASAPAAGQLEEIVVTGSRIRQATPEATPVTVISSEQIANTSTVTLEQFLSKVPAFGNQGLGENTNAGGDGVSFVELRNLGVSRTLVLVDGQRMVASGTDTQAAVNLNNIPVSLIDRVEVLRNGASAIYGSDAIAGVINIILKKDFEGMLTSAQFGMSDKGDAEKTQISTTFGHNFDRGNIVLNAEYAKVNPIRQTSRDWARNKILSDGTYTLASSRTYGGRVQNPSAPDKINNRPFIDVQALGNGAFVPYSSKYAFLVDENQFLRGSLERRSANGSARYDLTDDISAKVDFLFTDHKAQQQLNADSEGGDITTRAYPMGFVIPASNPYNPFGVNVTMRTRRQEIGNREYHETGPTYRMGAGLEGKIQDRFDWEVGYKYGKSDATFSFTNQINQERLLQVSGYLPCTASDVAKGCSVGNFFGPNSLTPAQAQYIGYTQVNKVGYEQQYGFGKISGPIVDLPAGALSFAAGVERRKESGYFQPDNVVVNGDANFDQEPTAGSYKATEAYLELRLPLLKDMPLAKELSIDAAARYSDYDRFGSAKTWNATLSYQPDSNLALRANLGSGFRAPSITDLFAGQYAGPAIVSDPCDTRSGLRVRNATAAANCNSMLTAAGVNPATFTQQAPQVYSLQGGNPNLDPEKSKQWGIGGTLTPGFIPGLRVTGDYYHVKIRDQIVAPDAQVILDQCYGSGSLSSPLCALVGARNQGQLTNISAVNTNSGRVVTDGIDFGFSYRFKLEDIGFAPDSGRIEISDENTYLLKYKEQLIDGSTRRLEGKITSAGLTPNAYTRFKSTATLAYSKDDWSVQWSTRYLSGAENYSSSGETMSKEFGSKVGSMVYNDIAGSYTLDNITVGVGVDNLFDKDPPFYFDSASNTLRNGYDFVGRYFYARTSIKF